MAHFAEPRTLQLQFVLFGSQRIVGEPQDLGAIIYTLRIPLMLRGQAMSKDFRHIIGFSPVHIPRFVT
jgi:hypothetical protein